MTTKKMSPSEKLSIISQHVDGMLESHQNRFDQAKALSVAVGEIKKNLSHLESENITLAGELSRSSSYVKELETSLSAAQKQNKEMKESHKAEHERLIAASKKAIADIQEETSQYISNIQTEAKTILDEIQAEYELKIKKLVARAEAAETSYNLMIVENDKLSQGLATIMSAIEERNADSAAEDDMIADMLKVAANFSEVSYGQSLIEKPMNDPLAFLRKKSRSDEGNASAS